MCIPISSNTSNISFNQPSSNEESTIIEATSASEKEIVTHAPQVSFKDVREKMTILDAKLKKLSDHLIKNGYNGLTMLCSCTAEDLFSLGTVDPAFAIFATELAANFHITQGVNDQSFEEELAVSLWHLARGALDSNLSCSERYELSHDLIAAGFVNVLRILFKHSDAPTVEKFLHWWVTPGKGTPYATLLLHTQTGFFLYINLLHRNDLSETAKFHVLQSMKNHTAYISSHLPGKADISPFLLKDFINYLLEKKKSLSFKEGEVVLQMLVWASKFSNLENAVALIEELYLTYLLALEKQSAQIDKLSGFREKLIESCQRLSDGKDHRFNTLIENLHSKDLPPELSSKNTEEPVASPLNERLFSSSKEVRNEAINTLHRELYESGGNLEIKLLINDPQEVVVHLMTLLAEESNFDQERILFESLYILLGYFKYAPHLHGGAEPLITHYKVPKKTQILFMKKVKDVLDLTPNETGRLKWCGAMASIVLSPMLVKIFSHNNGYRELIDKAEKTGDALCYAASIHSLLPQLNSHKLHEKLSVPHWLLRKPFAHELNRIFECIKTSFTHFFGLQKALYTANFHSSIGFHLIATEGELLYSYPYEVKEADKSRFNNFGNAFILNGLIKLLSMHSEETVMPYLEELKRRPLTSLLGSVTRAYVLNNHYTAASNKIVALFLKLIRQKAPEFLQQQLSQMNWNQVVGLEYSGPNKDQVLHPQYIQQSMLCMMQIGQALTDKEFIPIANALKDSLPLLLENAGSRSNLSPSSIPTSKQTISELYFPILDIIPTLQRLSKLWPKEYYSSFLQILIQTRKENPSNFRADCLMHKCEMQALEELRASNVFPQEEPIKKAQLKLLVRHFFSCETAVPGAAYSWEWIQLQLDRLSPTLFNEWLQEVYLNASTQGVPEKLTHRLLDYALKRPSNEVSEWKKQLLSIGKQSLSNENFSRFKEKIAGINRQLAYEKKLSSLQNDHRELQEAISKKREVFQSEAKSILERYQNLTDRTLTPLKLHGETMHASTCKAKEVRKKIQESANSLITRLVEEVSAPVDSLQKNFATLPLLSKDPTSEELNLKLDFVSERIAALGKELQDIDIPAWKSGLESRLQQVIDREKINLKTALRQIEQEESLLRGEAKAKEVEQLARDVMKIAENTLEDINSGAKTEERMELILGKFVSSLHQRMPEKKPAANAAHLKRLQHEQSVNERLQQQMREMQDRLDQMELDNARLRKAAAEESSTPEEITESVDIDNLINIIRMLNGYKENEIPKHFSSETAEAWNLQKGRLKKLSQLLSAVPLNSKGEIRLQDMQSIAWNSGFVQNSMKGDHLTIKHSIFRDLALTLVTNRKDKQIFYLRFLLEKVEESFVNWLKLWNEPIN